jgi:hypothetical protein
MAKKSDIQTLIDSINFKTTEWKTKSIVEDTADIALFDLQAAISELSTIFKPSVSDIVRIIHEHQTTQQYCGLCRTGWIPVLDYRTWNEAGQPDLNQRKVFIPKMDSPCPKCQPNRHPSLSERLAKMTEAERGWTFCILYDFYVYSLENDAKMDDFDPHRLWGVFDTEPHLTGAMMGFMAWINHGLDERLEQAKAKAQEQQARQVIHTAATARAFG